MIAVFGGLLSPELIDKPVGRDDLAHAHQQEPEQRPLLLTPKRHDAALIDDFERSEDPEVRHLSGFVPLLTTTA